ncbi:MAG: STT3 domain-containing protein, partial [Halobacteriaceae archaeon]
MSDTGDQLSSDSVLALLERWYHVIAVGALAVYMFWVRAQAHDNFRQGGEIFFSGNDPYYHFRQVAYTVRNYPAIMPFDAWTQFPLGTSVGQFGTLYDQLMATAALVVGLGSPTEATIETVMLFTPPVLGALVAVPTYFIGRRLG